MQAIKCNRCGKFFLSTEKYFILRILKSEDYNRNPQFIEDLCENCWKDFEKWMKEGRENEKNE